VPKFSCLTYCVYDTGLATKVDDFTPPKKKKFVSNHVPGVGVIKLYCVEKTTKRDQNHRIKYSRARNFSQVSSQLENKPNNMEISLFPFSSLSIFSCGFAYFLGLVSSVNTLRLQTSFLQQGTTGRGTGSAGPGRV
jgi:hypothetical protein